MKRSPAPFRVVLAVALLAVSAAGCNSGSSPAATSAAAPESAAAESSSPESAAPANTAADTGSTVAETVAAPNGAKKSGTIALLLPESKTTRYEAFDRPLFEKKVKELCADCKLVYSNADQDAAKQQSQAEAALVQGIDVLVLDAVDANAAVAIVGSAKKKNVPVIAYDRLISGAPIDFYVSFDNFTIGKQQGEALLAALSAGGDPKRGQIVMINGSPTDPSAGDYKRGAHAALDGKVNIGKEFDTPDWSPDKAQQEMEQSITALGKDKIIGVYAANDGTAGGAIAAMKRAGYQTLPPITGQDAELAAVQRIIAGDQYMTIYLRIKDEADAAAIAAVDILQGRKPASKVETDNGVAKVPSVLVDAVPVTKDKVKDTIIADGFYTAAQVCTAEFAKACTELGIK
jgi:D-xylose transport system substrate-binding protein